MRDIAIDELLEVLMQEPLMHNKEFLKASLGGLIERLALVILFQRFHIFDCEYHFRMVFLEGCDDLLLEIRHGVRLHLIFEFN